GADKFVSLWKSFWLKISLVGYGSTTPNEVKKPRISDSRERCFKALGNVLRASSNGRVFISNIKKANCLKIS
ncbi:hypothetical protein BpHYR1_042183, partial [Brachionus plicatilis]